MKFRCKLVFSNIFIHVIFYHSSDLPNSNLFIKWRLALILLLACGMYLTFLLNVLIPFQWGPFIGNSIGFVYLPQCFKYYAPASKKREVYCFCSVHPSFLQIILFVIVFSGITDDSHLHFYMQPPLVVPIYTTLTVFTPAQHLPSVYQLDFIFSNIIS